jgi:hypothetical protein
MGQLSRVTWEHYSNQHLFTCQNCKPDRGYPAPHGWYITMPDSCAYQSDASPCSLNSLASGGAGQELLSTLTTMNFSIPERSSGDAGHSTMSKRTLNVLLSERVKVINFGEGKGKKIC